MLGKVGSHLRDNLFERMDRQEVEALMAEFEKWSNDPNPLLRKMSFM